MVKWLIIGTIVLLVFNDWELNAHDIVGYRDPDSIEQIIICNIPDPAAGYINATEEQLPIRHLSPGT